MKGIWKANDKCSKTTVVGRTLNVSTT